MNESKPIKLSLPENQPDSLPEPTSTVSDCVVKEINGPKGLEPTRYGDWEKAGRCIDF